MAEQLDPKQLEEARKLAQELNIAFNENVRSAQELELTIKGMRARLNEINTELSNSYDYFRKITEQLKNTNVATNDLKKSYSNLTSAAQTIQQVQLGNQTLSLKEISNLRDKIALNKGIADAALETYKRDENALISKIANEKRISTEQAKAAFEAQKALTTNKIQQEELNSFLNEQNILSNQNFSSLTANLQQQEKLKDKLNNQKNISGAVIANYKAKLTILQNEATILENNQKLFDDENNMIESSLKDLQSQEVSLNSQINLLGEHKNKLNDLAELRQEQEDRAKNLNEETQVLLNYLKEEETYQNNINKSMGITGALASGLETTLNKIGLSKLSQQLGIGDALTKTKGFAQQITAGSNGVATMSQKFQIAGNLIKNMGSSLMKSLGPLALLAELVETIKASDKATGDLAKGFNVTYNEANNLRQELNTIANSSGDIAVTTKDLQESMMAVGTALGTNVMLNKEDLITMTQLAEKAGISREEQMGMLKLSLATGKSLESNVGEFVAQASIQAQNNGIIVNEKQLLKEVNNLSNAIKLSVGGTGGELGKAVASAKALGMNLEQVDKIAGSLLQFESSISAELEAELLTGKQLNLEKARYYALTNDAVGLAEELSKNVGTSAEFGKMNRLQQEAYAKALGMSREEIAASLVESEALKNMTEDQAAAASSAFKARVADVGLEKAQKELAEGKLKDMMNQQSMQERFNQSVEKLKEIFVTVADALMPILNIFVSIFSIIGKIMKFLDPMIQTILVGVAMIEDILKGIAFIFGSEFGKSATIEQIGRAEKSSQQNYGGSLNLTGMAPPTPTPVGDVAYSPGKETIISTKEGGLFKPSNNDQIAVGPKVSDILLNNKKETLTNTSSTNASIDINPLLEAINRLEAAINSRPIMVETKIELDGQQISYNQSTGTNSFRS